VGGATEPLGVVLAGGAATRLGGSKATAELAGRPLVSYPLAAFGAAGIEVVVVAKPATELPPLDVAVVIEPGEPTHPLLGLVIALEHAGRPIVSAPCDTPFITPALLTTLAAAAGTAAAHDTERFHPLIARYRYADLPVLREALAARRSATSALEALAPASIAVDPGVAFNVNTPADLEAAGAALRG
jgi:molybdopterin-guanine dinucleotide biosynthesis protein A